jgi:hypothetical protein
LILADLSNGCKDWRRNVPVFKCATDYAAGYKSLTPDIEKALVPPITQRKTAAQGGRFSGCWKRERRDDSAAALLE